MADKFKIDANGTVTGRFTPPYVELRSYVPTGLTLSPLATGGSMSDGAHSYTITSYTSLGESLASAAVNITLSGGGSAQQVVLTWARVPGVTGYRIYKTTFATVRVADVVGQDTVTFTHSGAAGTGEVEPVEDAASDMYAGSNGSTRMGYASTVRTNGTSFGYGNTAYDHGVAMGNNCDAHDHGVATGFGVNAHTYGVGMDTHANDHAVSFGIYSSGATNYSVNLLGVASNYSVVAGFGANGGSEGGVAVGTNSSVNGMGPTAVAFNGTATRHGEFVRGHATKHQWSIVDWFADTTDATATEIFLTNVSGQRLTLTNNSAVMFEINVSARDNTNNCAAGWHIVGVASRGASAAATSIHTNETPASHLVVGGGSSNDWTCTPIADTTNGAIGFRCTGASGVTVRWNARGNLTEGRS